MADYKLVNATQLDADLKTVADAIREKGGTTEDLEFPLGMKSAVEAIQSGGSDEEFIGIKYSDFTGLNGLPQVADASSLPLYGIDTSFGGYSYLFANNNSNPNGGFNVCLKEIFLPKMPKIPQYLLQDCYMLTTLHCDFEGAKSLGAYSFLGCKALTELPSMLDVEIIETKAAESCISLKKLPYMPKLRSVAANSFGKCTGLTKVNIYNTLTTFNANAFNGCTNITDIYVPWSEGEVANAPWGATNATIHYNTTYDENHNPIV